MTRGSAVKAKLPPVGSCLAELHWLVRVLIDEVQLTVFHRLDKPGKSENTVPIISIMPSALIANSAAASRCDQSFCFAAVEGLACMAVGGKGGSWPGGRTRMYGWLANKSDTHSTNTRTLADR